LTSDCVNEYTVIHDATNLSDHLPVLLNVNLPVYTDICKFIALGYSAASTSNLTKSSNNSNKLTSKKTNLRWDHGDTNLYYYTTGDLLYPIYNELVSYGNGVDKLCEYERDSSGVNCTDKIESWYTRSINALFAASDHSIPSIPHNCLKVWWNSELSDFKKQAIASHALWVSGGKPKEGLLHSIKSKDKVNYKMAIKRTSVVSEQLHESLAHKNARSFWKTWKNKICKRTTNEILIKGNSSDSEACIEFASFFQKTSSPNCSNFDNEKQKEYENMIDGYAGDKLAMNKFHFSAELLAFSVDKMK
jgi:uncharacterized protein involved in tolerance to divalent cations